LTVPAETVDVLIRVEGVERVSGMGAVEALAIVDLELGGIGVRPARAPPDYSCN
jgi:hypothetical protein